MQARCTCLTLSFLVSDIMRHAATAAYTPNADLASLLGHSIDQRNHLIDATGFVGYQHNVKPEPFDGYLAIGHIAHNGAAPITSDGTYQLVQPGEYISYAPMMSMTMPSVVTMPSSAGNSPEQVLPVCPVPTEKTIDTFYSGHKFSLERLYQKLRQERYVYAVLEVLIVSFRPALNSVNVVHARNIASSFDFCVQVVDYHLNTSVQLIHQDDSFSRIDVRKSALNRSFILTL